MTDSSNQQSNPDTPNAQPAGTTGTTSRVMQKGLWGMARPMLLEQTLVFTIPLMDTYFLSRISDNAAAAVGSIMAFLFFANTLLFVTAFAGSSVASQRMGADDYPQANATIFVYGVMLVFASIFAVCLIYFLGPFVTTVMGLPPEIKSMADLYLSIAAFMVGAWGIRSIFQSILTLYGLPQWNLFSNLVGFSLNVLGNGMVVFGWFGCPAYGLPGIAWVSVIASCVGILILVLVVFLKLKLRFDFVVIRERWKDYSRQVGRIVGPSVVEPMSFDINMIVLSGIVAQVGAAALAARTYTFNTYLTLLVITMAFSTANEVIIAQLVGAKKYLQANRQLHQCLRIVLVGISIIGLVYLVNAGALMRLYTDNQDIISMASIYFLLAFLSEPGRAINIITGNALRGTGDGWFISITGLSFTWLVAMPLAYILAIVLGYGLTGVLVSAVVDESVRCMIYYWRWRQNRWQHTNVIAREQQGAGGNLPGSS